VRTLTKRTADRHSHARVAQTLSRTEQTVTEYSLVALRRPSTVEL